MSPGRSRGLGRGRALAWAVPAALLAAASLAGPWVWPHLLPQSWSGRAWGEWARMAPTVASSWGLSLGLSLGAVALGLAASLAAARSLADRPRPLVEALLLVPALVPPLGYLWGLQAVFLRLGWTDAPWGVVVALTIVTFPYTLRALVDGYRQLPPGLLDCAANLGASRLTVLVRVELPLLVPSVVAGTTVAFLAAWSDWYVAFLIGGGSLLTYPLVLYPFLLSSDRAVGSAGVLLFLVVPLVVWKLGDRWVGARGVSHV